MKVYLSRENIYYHQPIGALQSNPPYEDPTASISEKYEEIYLVDENAGKFILVARAPYNSPITVVGSHLYHCVDEFSDSGDNESLEFFLSQGMDDLRNGSLENL